MNQKKVAASVIVIIILLLLFYAWQYQQEYVKPNDITNGDQTENIWDAKPPTGVRRDPLILYDGGSNPSLDKSWPTFKHDMQRTGFTNLVGNGNINNYGLLYHRWQDSFSHPVVADLDGNGKYEIISYSEGDQDQSTYIWSTQGIKLHAFDGEVLWNFDDYEGDVWAPPAIADINNDGFLEIIIPLRSEGAILVLDRNGNSMWEFQVEGGRIESSPGVADIKNDGRMEIIFGVNFPYEDTASVYAIYSENNEPKILWKFRIQDIPDKKKTTVVAPVVVDIDGDGKLETIIGSFNGYLYVIRSNGELYWKFYTENYESDFGGIYAPPTACDLDGDGNIEILFQTHNDEEYEKNKLYCLNAYGKELWNYSYPISKPFSSSGVSVADINDDGWLEILLGTRDKYFFDNKLLAINLKGETIWEYELNEDYVTGSAPTIVDLDGDDNLEIVMITKNNLKNSLKSNLLIIDSLGSNLWEYTLNGYSWTSPPIVDLNSDGKLEILVGVYESGDYSENGQNYARDEAKLGLYVFGDMSSSDLIDLYPDLAIKASMVEISQPSIREMKVTVKVANAGLVDVSNVDVKVQTNIQTVGIEIIDIIPSLSTVSFELTWSGAAVEITVTVDSDDKINESDEENNLTSKYIQ